MEKLTITITDPPRPRVKSRPQQLFQTIEGLRVQYGHTERRREQIMNGASAILIAAVLFGILHVAILFLEQ
jgi:hypothetical protein